MVMEREKTGSGNRPRWYGTPASRGFNVYRDIEERYIEIFDALREGRIPDVQTDPRLSLPDIRDIMISYARYRVKKEFTQDQYVRKFYSLIPELDRSVNLILEKVMNFGLITGVSYNSDDPCRFLSSLRGLDLPADLSAMLDDISVSAGKLCDLRASLVSFLNMRISRIMPNTSAIAGEELAAELLYHAGSLRNLALMPASSIQVLGAEKALFKHVVTGSPPPKHGVLFHFRGMSALKPRTRGRVARVIAGKIAIAARADLAGTVIDTGSMVKQIKEAMAKK